MKHLQIHSCLGLALASLAIASCRLAPHDSRSLATEPEHRHDLIGPFPLVRVVDGDTLWIDRDGQLEKLRLQGVDAEERFWDYGESRQGYNSKSQTDFGEQTARWAQAYFEQLGPRGQRAQVMLELPAQGPKRDAFGRLLCQVFTLDRTHFNLLLVKLGKSPYYNKYGSSSCDPLAFEDAERSARDSGLGIWSVENQGRSDAPPYPRLEAWWQARALAVDDCALRRNAGELIIDASDELALHQALDRQQAAPAKDSILFGSIQRFYEERDGSLTVLMHAGKDQEGLRLVIPKELRGTRLERIVRQAQPKFRQNYLYLSGQLSLGERGICMLAQASSDWRPAGPEPNTIALATNLDG